MRVTWVLPVAAFLLLAAAPSQAILVSSDCGAAAVHRYVQGAPDSDPILVQPIGCGPDSDAALGIGAVFLDAAHHTNEVCMYDDVAGDATFFAGLDGNGDGIVSDERGDALVGPLTGCAELPFEGPGADGGWWVILGWNAFHGTIITR